MEPDTHYALKNAVWGDGDGIECKASAKTANVCISPFELSVSRCVALAAWVPTTAELFWVADMDEVRDRPGARFWLSPEDVWLVRRDSIEVL